MVAFEEVQRAKRACLRLVKAGDTMHEPAVELAVSLTKILAEASH